MISEPKAAARSAMAAPDGQCNAYGVTSTRLGTHGLLPTRGACTAATATGKAPKASAGNLGAGRSARA